MKTKNENFQFIKFSKNDISDLFSTRIGETKLGEVINNSNQFKYVILGIEESTGPKANKGRNGAENGYKAFLNTFLNMQSNESLEGNDILVLGKIQQINKIENELSDAVEELDNFVYEVLKAHISAGQIPIVIGGGHNNAFPLMHFSSKACNDSINVVNLDAHADYRLLEGRHSGNPFSYAFSKDYLDDYQVFGLHQRYNSQQILDDLKRDKHSFTFNEDYLFGKRDYLNDFKSKAKTLKDSDKTFGIELDLDVIQRMPASAYTPVGVSIALARQYINVFAQLKNVAYLHLPEGAPQTEEEDKIVGKTLSYLVSDFIIGQNESK